MTVELLYKQLRVLQNNRDNSDTQEERDYWTKKIAKKLKEIGDAK